MPNLLVAGDPDVRKRSSPQGASRRHRLVCPRMRTVYRAMVVVSCLACPSGRASATGNPAAEDALGSPRFANATSRYSIQFLAPVPDSEGLLWSKVVVSKPGGGRQVVRTAAAPVAGETFAAFSWKGGDDEVERGDLWSPDGHFVALRGVSCIWSPGSVSPVTCHLHEVALVDLDHPDDDHCGLLLGRYNFSGWADDKPHSAMYSPALDGELREADLGSCPPSETQIQPPSRP